MKEVPRVAYFPDSYLEVNGVARTSKHLTRYAREKGYPFLCVHAGPENAAGTEGSVRYLSLRRSALSIAVDEALKYDPFFQRHVGRVRRALEEFKPDVVHITGVNDVGIIGAYLAWKMDVAIIGSWHTNLHEYAAIRLTKLFRFLPRSVLAKLSAFLEAKILDGEKLYYKIPQIILAPNEELVEMLAEATGRKVRLMLRGVDTAMFSPDKRTVDDVIVRFGYVGRLRPEKNVRLLAAIERGLLEAGMDNFRFLIVGEGDERRWLEKNMTRADLTGFLEGAQLAEAYANMDVFVFPSETDSYGNVPQEAMASGVPVIVSDKGGPKFIVRAGETGFIAENEADFIAFARRLLEDKHELAEMKRAALAFARARSWESVFDKVYEAYAETREFMDSKKRKREA